MLKDLSRCRRAIRDRLFEFCQFARQLIVLGTNGRTQLGDPVNGSSDVFAKRVPFADRSVELIVHA